MKKYGFEETSKKSIHSKDLVKPTMELLIAGSNGSKVCDDVENEIKNKKKKKDVDKYLSDQKI